MTSKPSLTFRKRQFFLDSQPLRIFSGAIHYFRVVPEYWEDRLVKARACGLNTIETYVPWNLHEPKPGVFRNEGILDLRRFITLAGDLGLHVILRPGPFICSEWDFGGLPSWLLADPEMKVRTNYPGYQQAAERYFSWLLPQVTDLQRSKGKGPIIAVQVENEYGSFSDNPSHMKFVKELLLENGVGELLVSSDNESAARTAPIIDGVLPTANGQTVEEIEVSFDVIKKFNPEFPLIVMEFWSGWFDHWGKPHETRSVSLLETSLDFAFKQDASVNFYMFHGGTNFGFMAGALNLSRYKADITSYDYDAPLSEEGRVTEKYLKIREMIEKEIRVKNLNGLPSIPSVPANSARAANPISLKIKSSMEWSDLLQLVEKKSASEEPKFMEMYSYANDDIQSYGYIVYRKRLGLSDATTLRFTGPVRDRAMVLVDGGCTGRFSRGSDDKMFTVEIPKKGTGQSGTESLVDVVVENQGRVNYTLKDRQEILNQQRKGLSGPVFLGESELQGWEVFALDFSEDFMNGLAKSDKWKAYEAASGTSPGANLTPNAVKCPGLYRLCFELPETPVADLFVDLKDWDKGVVFVNGFNLGRYWNIGPQRTLYLPAPLLKAGRNEIIVFEESGPGDAVTLAVEPCLDVLQPSQL